MHPCFYLEELKLELEESFPELLNVSLSTICRALRHDCNLSLKKLERRSRRAIPQEIEDFKYRLRPFYTYPHQLVFIDETSKDGRSAIREKGWSPRGKAAIARLPSDRGPRVSTLAAFSTDGFFAWTHTSGTFTRRKFHDSFIRVILPHLQPWPMPNSIVLIDNARIHMYEKLEEIISSRGALLFFLPPYSPHINPIEYGFSLVKRFIKKYGNLAFAHEAELVLDVALGMATDGAKMTVNMIEHCGYRNQQLMLKQ